MPTLPKPDYSAFYRTLTATLTEVGWMCGYAMGFHGSQKRDLDVIAVPWIEEATDAEYLVKMICEEFNVGWTQYAEHCVQNNLRAKSHGRLCWSLHFRGANGRFDERYIDLSVMTKTTNT